MSRLACAGLRIAPIAWLCVSSGLSATHREHNWPKWRGPTMTAVVADDPALPETWSATENVAWQIAIPGLGWSSPIVWDDTVFVTSVVADVDYAQPRAGLYLPETGVERPPDLIPGTHRWMVYAVDLESGQLRWQRTAHAGPVLSPRHPKNSFASATPVTDWERLYVLFGNLGLFAYAMDGTLLWSHRLEPRADKWGWGAGSSPTLLGDQLIIVHDNEEESYIASFDVETGSQNWRQVRDETSAWSTPVIWRNELRTEIITVGKEKVRSYDASGRLLWYFSGNMTELTIPTPIPTPERVYVSSGYIADAHRPVYAIRPGASGDITLGPDERTNEFIVWYRPAVGSYNPSPILYRNFYYTLHDRGFLTAHDAETGEPAYDRQRIARGATFTSSPWAYNGKIFVMSEDGDTFVIQAGPQFAVLGKNSLDEMTLATPAVAQGSLIVRTASKLYRISDTDKQEE